MSSTNSVARTTNIADNLNPKTAHTFTDHHFCDYTCGLCNRTEHPCDNGIEDWKCNLFLVDGVTSIALVSDGVASCEDQPTKNRRWLRSGMCARTCVTAFAEFKMHNNKYESWNC